MRNRFLRVSGLTLGVLLLVSSGVKADNYETSFSLPGDATVTVSTYTNPANPTGTTLGPEGTWAVPFTMTDTTHPTLPTFQAFCIDLYHNVSDGQTTTNNPSFQSVAGAQGFGAKTSGTNGTPIPNYSGFTTDFGSKLNYLGYVYESILTANHGAYSSDTYLLGAVQLAVWTLLDVNFKATGENSGMANDLTAILNAIGATASNGSNQSTFYYDNGTANGAATTGLSLTGYSTSAIGHYGNYGGTVLVVHTNLDDGGNIQNVITWNPVPEPSSMAIAGLGALGFLAYGLRRRKVS